MERVLFQKMLMMQLRILPKLNGLILMHLIIKTSKFISDGKLVDKAEVEKTKSK